MGEMYFNEAVVLSATKEFQATGNQTVVYPFTDQIQKLVRGVINRHELWRFWDNTMELENEGFKTAFECLARFDPTIDKTLFNYLSISVKWRLINFTRKFNDQGNIEVALHEEIVTDEELNDENNEQVSYSTSPQFGVTNHLIPILCCEKPQCQQKSLQICKKLEEALGQKVTNDTDLVLYVMNKLPHTELVVRHVLECAKQKKRMMM